MHRGAPPTQLAAKYRRPRRTQPVNRSLLVSSTVASRGRPIEGCVAATDARPQQARSDSGAGRRSSRTSIQQHGPWPTFCRDDISARRSCTTPNDSRDHPKVRRLFRATAQQCDQRPHPMLPAAVLPYPNHPCSWQMQMLASAHTQGRSHCAWAATGRVAHPERAWYRTYTPA